MTNFYDWSETASSNASSDETINFAEFQNPDTVNDSARAMMARIAQWRKDNAPTRVSTGTGNAYAVTSQAGGSTGYTDGEIVTFIADRANTGACTLNVNSRGAKAFRPAVGVAFSANEIQANQPIIAFYRSSTDEWLAVGSGYHVTAMTSGALTQSIAARLIKIGTPVLSLAPSPNSGYVRLTESTQALNKADWPELSSYLSGLSTPYPWGSTSTTFNLPPAAGYVLRFAATSSSIDTSGARTAGSTQSDQVTAHTHTFTGTGTTSSDGAHTHTEAAPSGSVAVSSGGSSAVAGGATVATSSAGTHSHTVTVSGTTASAGGDEVRVKNVAMHVDIFASSQLSAGTIGMFGWPFSWDTGTTAADPGTARVRGNSATLASITSLLINETDSWGVNIGAILGSFQIGDTIRLSKIGSQSNTLVATVSGSISDLGTYRSIPITVLVANGTFSNGDSLALELSGGVGTPGTTVPDIDGLTAVDALATGDKFILYDASASAHKSITKSKLLPTYDLVRDFGAVGDGNTANRSANNTAWSSAMTALASGGKLTIPLGEFQCSATVNVPSNIVIEGSGYGTIINFGALGGSGHTGAGFNLGTSDKVVFRDLYVTQAAGAGFASAQSGGNNPSDFLFENVFSRFNGGSGFSLDDAYGVVMINCEATDNGGAGFEFPGYHTSLTLMQCQASSNTASGFVLKDVTYSSLIGCGADLNSQYAYNLANIGGVSLISCGSETNTQGGILVQASNALASGAIAPDVNGLALIGCFSWTNSSVSFLECASSDSRVINVTIQDCYDQDSPGGTSISATGATTIRRIGGSFEGSISITSPATLNNLLGVTPGLDKLPYFDSASSATSCDLTSFARTILDDANASAARTTLGLAIGTDVQAYDADLGALAGNSTNGLWARTGAGTGSARTVTGTSNEITVTNGDGVSGNPTVSIPTSVTFTGKTVTGGTYSSPTLSGTITIPSGQITSGGALRIGTTSGSRQIVLQGGTVDTGEGLEFRNTGGFTLGYFGPDSNTDNVRLVKTSGAVDMSITSNNGIKIDGTTVKFPSISTTASAANAFLDSGANNSLLRSTSSIKYKTDVETLDLEYARKLLKLRPVWYRSLAEADPKGFGYYGFIAEELAEIDPRLVHWGYQDDQFEDVEIAFEATVQDTVIEQVEETYTETVWEEYPARASQTVEINGEAVKVEFDVPAWRQVPVTKTRIVDVPRIITRTEPRTRTERRLKAGEQKRPDGVQYERLTVGLVKLVQDLHNRGGVQAAVGGTDEKVRAALADITPDATLPQIAQALVALKAAVA